MNKSTRKAVLADTDKADENIQKLSGMIKKGFKIAEVLKLRRIKTGQDKDGAGCSIFINAENSKYGKSEIFIWGKS